ncbi:Dormancy-associated protein-like 4, partial [Mucuna pruriens]
MGLLDKLWDETLAGPAPETGLSKLRKYKSLSAAASVRSATAPDVPISRSITIIRTHSDLCRTTTTSDPSSPSVPITPRTPLTPETPGGDFKKFTRRKSSTAGSAENTNDTYALCVYMPLFSCVLIFFLFHGLQGDYECFGSLLRGEMRCFAFKFEYHSAEAEGLRFLYIRQHRFQFPKGIISCHLIII